MAKNMKIWVCSCGKCNNYYDHKCKTCGKKSHQEFKEANDDENKDI